MILNKILDLYKKYKELINYLIFGFLTTVVSLVIYYLLTFTVINPEKPLLLQLANIISWISGVIFAYITNRKYVFESNNKDVLKESLSFVGARVITLILDMIIMGVGVTLLNKNDKIVKIISQIIVIVSNYLFSKIIVFKEEK